LNNDKEWESISYSDKYGFDGILADEEQAIAKKSTFCRTTKPFGRKI
jgi:hypothetical protein